MSSNEAKGLVIGLVSDLEDPASLGRIRVKYPHLGDSESQWARLAQPMAGPDRGVFFRPEVGDEVAVGFELGDPRRPYILGSLWNTEDTPPEDDGNAKENNWRFIKSRSGHLVKLDDTSGAEKIEIVGKDEQHKIVIDVAEDKIQIICDSGDIELTASAGAVKIEAQDVEVHAANSMSLKADGQMTIEGSSVNIN